MSELKNSVSSAQRPPVRAVLKEKDSYKTNDTTISLYADQLSNSSAQDHAPIDQN
jgi:hypothetical protein